MPYDLTLLDARFETSAGASVLSGGAGVVDWVAFPPANAIYTIEAWVRTTQVDVLQVAAGQVTAGWIGVLVGGHAGGHVGGAGTRLDSGVFIADGGWHHLAIVGEGLGRDGAFFVDGVRAGTQAAVSASAAITQFAVGDFGGAMGVGFRWTGWLAGVALWTVARYGAEFSPSRTPCDGTESGLFALFHLDGDGRDAAMAAMFPADDPAISWSGGNWHVTPRRAVTIDGGAWLRVGFTGPSISLSFDVSNMVESASQIAYRIDRHGEWIAAAVAAVVPLTIAVDIAGADAHSLEVCVKSTTEFVAPPAAGQRWDPASRPNTAVVLTGITLSPGGGLSAVPAAARMVWVFGDSITEGFRALGDAAAFDVDWSDSRLAYAAQLGPLLDADISQIGFGGQSWLAGGQGGVPSLQQSYARLHAGAARDFSEPPDIIVINMGCNDGTADTTRAVTAVLDGILAVCPATPIAVVRPFDSVVGAAQAPFLVAGIAACAEPSRVSYVDSQGFWDGSESSDGVHPNGVAGAAIAVHLAAALRPLLEPKPAEPADVADKPSGFWRWWRRW